MDVSIVLYSHGGVERLRYGFGGVRKTRVGEAVGDRKSLSFGERVRGWMVRGVSASDFGGVWSKTNLTQVRGFECCLRRQFGRRNIDRSDRLRIGLSREVCR